MSSPKHTTTKTALVALAFTVAILAMSLTYWSYCGSMTNLDVKLLAPILFGVWSVVGVLALVFRRLFFVADILLAQALLTLVILTGDDLPDADALISISCVGMIVGILTGLVHAALKAAARPAPQS